MSRERTLRRAALDLLERAEPYALPERQLQIELNGRVRPPAGQAEFEDMVTYLATRKFIALLQDSLDPERSQWLITETGKALLRK